MFGRLEHVDLREVWKHETDGFSMTWLENPDKKSSRIIINHDVDFRNSEEWHGSFKWLVEKIETVKSVFGEYK